MDTPFLTIAEAVEKTGRSASTIRRLIRIITTAPDHPDRAAVEPSTQEVAAFKEKGANFTWKIREDIVLREFSSAPKEEKKKVSSDLPSNVFNILEKELELKNQQIEKQWEVIHALNDRLREGNILMGSLQKQLAAPPANPAVQAVVETVTAKNVEDTVKGTKKAPKTSKKGFLSWFR